MTQIDVAVSAMIDAPAEHVYNILADYDNHHPHILPKAYFSKLEVEEGGYGAGTILRVELQVLGIRQQYHMRVSEPEPGRVLAETDINTGLVTTFTVKPRRDHESEVTISTTWEPQAGVKGLIERLTTPPIMRRIYRQELQQLDEYAQLNRAAT